MKKALYLSAIAALALAGIAYANLSPAHRAMVDAKLSTAMPNGIISAPETRASDPWSAALIAAARSQIGVTTQYDGAYVQLSYPGGDVPRATGVCTDVVIRALRDAHAIDLQKAVHNDMATAFAAYPDFWGLTRPDTNIDHRRVPNLRRYFERRGYAQPVSDQPQDYLPGDLVTWQFGPGAPHIGIVSDRIDRKTGEPLIFHNVGAGTREQRFLFAYPISGHYRLRPPQSET